MPWASARAGRRRCSSPSYLLWTASALFKLQLVAMGGPASGGGSQRKRKKREERQAQAERDKQKRMAKTGRAVAAPAPVNRRKDSREPESMLSEELTAELMQEGTGMSVEDFIFDPKAPKPAPAPKPSAAEVKMSNSQAKKLQRPATRIAFCKCGHMCVQMAASQRVCPRGVTAAKEH